MLRHMLFMTYLICVPCCVAVSVSQTTGTATSDTLKSYEIDEVITTGTRSEKRIIDIPYSVERIDKVKYKFDRKVAIDDVLRDIPGLFLQSRYGNHDVRISIRGFGSRSNTGIRGVRILLDGIPESEPDGQTRIEAIDFHSIGKIELVKGNSSSLYTNAPGGVINFMNDIFFVRPFFVQFNEFGSFGLKSNGLKGGVRTDDYGFLATYNHHEATGYREHSEDRWNIVNSVLETKPSEFTNFNIYMNFVDGIIRLPGSLTRAQFDQDPSQPNSRDKARDAKRITKKGRVGLQLKSFLNGDKNKEVELTTYGTIKYFHRTARTYRIITRFGLGATARFVHRSNLLGRSNEFSVGGDVVYQTGPVEEYDNINGKKGDLLEALTDETIGNSGLYIQNSLNLIRDRLDLLVSGRFDKVYFDTRNQLLGVQDATRKFEQFTPKVALNYKITRSVAAFTSYGASFDTPAGNELENYPTSSNPTLLLNPDLLPQKSTNFEVGLKGNIVVEGWTFLSRTHFEATFFRSNVKDEVVPFEVFGEVFFRNSAKTDRAGVELGAGTEIVSGLRLKSAYTFSDFTYDSYSARTIEFDTLGNLMSFDRSFAGNIVPSVPRHNFSLTLSYDHEITETFTGFIKGNFISISSMFVDDQNTESTGAYQIMNSLLGLDIKIDYFNLLLSGGVNNITDRTYTAFININSASKEFYEVGEPRNFFASINLGITF